MNSTKQFEAIVDEQYEPLYRFAMSLTRRESDAQDLTQQTFYILATKGHQLRDIGKIKNWLFTTLHRRFLMARRRQSRFPHHDLDEVAEELPTSLPESPYALDSSQVLSALALVDDVYQAALALFYLEDCSYAEIATILEVPVGTVKSRIARGIAQLRNILSPDGRRQGPASKVAAPPRPSLLRPAKPQSPAGSGSSHWQGASKRAHTPVAPWVVRAFSTKPAG